MTKNARVLGTRLLPLLKLLSQDISKYFFTYKDVDGTFSLDRQKIYKFSLTPRFSDCELL